ncbi:MAG: tetratricopeptide repeat protein, partial [Pyrinomonadaceae bacterium]
MSKDNILFSVIGVLLGFIIGFFFANSVNQRGTAPRAQAPTATQAGNLPPDHPPIASNAVADQGDSGGAGAMMPQVQETLEKARNEPNNYDAQMRAAAMYAQINRYDQALEFLLKANQLRPDSYETIVALGDVNYDLDKYEAAEKWYTIALQKKPDDVNVRTDLGTTFIKRTPPDFDRAIKEFRRALEINPNHEQTLHNLVIALTQKGDFKEAESALNKLQSVNPNTPDLDKL